MRVVPLRHGWLWIRTALPLFARGPLLWMLSVLSYWLALSVLNLLPWLGSALAVICVPTFSVGFMNISKIFAEGRRPSPIELFTGFKMNTKALIALGAIYFLACLASVSLVSLLDGGLLLDAFQRGKPPAPGVERSLALLGVTYTPIMLAYWFAPTLCAWQNMSVGKALFFSFFAAVRNWRAMLFYGLMLFLLFVLVASGLSLLTRLIAPALIFSGVGARGMQTGAVTLAFVAVPLILAGWAILAASLYACYQDVFGDTAVQR